MIVVQPLDKLWAFINARTGCQWSSDFRAIGIVRDDCLKAVIAYNGFTGRMCFMHSAIDDPSVINRTFVRAIFEYPFVQLGLSHVVALVEEDNQRALDIDKRCGFRETHRLEGAAMNGGDLIVLEMRRNDCRWIRHGKELLSRFSDPESAARCTAVAVDAG